jgi:hypothetical protein
VKATLADTVSAQTYEMLGKAFIRANEVSTETREALAKAVKVAILESPEKTLKEDGAIEIRTAVIQNFVASYNAADAAKNEAEYLKTLVLKGGSLIPAGLVEDLPRLANMIPENSLPSILSGKSAQEIFQALTKFNNDVKEALATVSINLLKREGGEGAAALSGYMVDMHIARQKYNPQQAGEHLQRILTDKASQTLRSYMGFMTTAVSKDQKVFKQVEEAIPVAVGCGALYNIIAGKLAQGAKMNKENFDLAWQSNLQITRMEDLPPDVQAMLPPVSSL